MTQPNPAASVKRYAPVIYIAQPPTWCKEFESGDFVKWHDYQAAIAERDAAHRECERLEKSLKLYPDLNAINKNLQAANRAIKSMGETANAEHRELRAEVERLKADIKRISGAIKRAARQMLEMKPSDALDECYRLISPIIEHVLPGD